jgi:NADP-dependent 3-hydroxy acid dehydrogenase YdfG
MASPKLKPLDQQVIVITGASSGIGLATAELAVQKGASVVLAARSKGALNDIVNRLNAAAPAGGQLALAVECDVADRAQVERVAQAALGAFGRIDTWVNNAGVSIYARLDEASEADNRRLFDTNFWGVVNGSLVALAHLRGHGGALINVGSEVSDAVIPLQAMYSASKHAVKGFTDGLRIEIEEIDQAPVSITLVQPTAVDTPYPQHARNYMPEEPALPTPQVDPTDVAREILDAAVRPQRVKKVGTMSHVNTTMSKLAPALAEKMAAGYVGRQRYDEPPRNPEGALHRPGESTGVIGRTHGTGGREKDKQAQKATKETYKRD